MMHALAFFLYSPLQSWGEVAVGDVRNTYHYPSKSALVGFISGAMGLDRYRDEGKSLSLARQLTFAIRLDGKDAVVMDDYHTTQVPPARRGVGYRTRAEELSAPDLQTILSTREYLCDAAFSVFCFGPMHLLEQIHAKLERPARPLYLGRKSCPLACPCMPKVLQGATLREIQSQYAVPQAVRDAAWVPVKKAGAEARIAWEEGIEAGIPATKSIKRYDMPVSRSGWQFAPRTETIGFVVLP